MTIPVFEHNPLSSPRLGYPNRRSSGAGGYRVPRRLADGSRLCDLGLDADLAALRCSRTEAGAPERF